MEIEKWGERLVGHTAVSRNFGLLGGYLWVIFYTYSSGDPAGVTISGHYKEGSLSCMPVVDD